MCKFYNFIISRTTITFNNISTIHKNIFILSNRTYFFFSPCAKLNFSRSDFRQNCANFEKYFLPMWKFVIHGFIIYRKRGIEYSSRGEKSNTGGGGWGREDSYRPTFSTNTFDAATRRNVLASGLTIIVYFTSSTGHSSVSALHRTSRGDNFFPAAHPSFPPPKNHYDRFGQWSIDLLRTRGDSV